MCVIDLFSYGHIYHHVQASIYTGPQSFSEHLVPQVVPCVLLDPLVPNLLGLPPHLTVDLVPSAVAFLSVIGYQRNATLV